METPYHFDFNGDSLQRTLLHQLPSTAKYPLKAVQESFFFSWKEAKIVSQQLNDYPFFFDMVEFSLRREETIPIRLHHKNLFLFFMLEGEAIFSSHEDQRSLSLLPNTYFLSAGHPGRFELKAKAGKLTALSVAISSDWVEKKLKKLNHIQEFTRMFRAESQPGDTLFLCRIDKHVDSLLEKIYNYPMDNLGMSDGYLTTCISSLLAHYNDKIGSGLAGQAKDYIDNNFRDPLLNVSMLAEHVCATPQTLRNHFIRIYDTSVQKYYTTLRMEHALALRSEGLSDSEIYEQVGYVNIRSFKSTMYRYLKRKAANR